MFNPEIGRVYQAKDCGIKLPAAGVVKFLNHCLVITRSVLGYIGNRRDAQGHCKPCPTKMALHVQVMDKGSVKRTLLREYFFPFKDIGSDLCRYFTNCPS